MLAKMFLQLTLFCLSVTFGLAYHCVFLRNDCSFQIVKNENCVHQELNYDNTANNDCQGAHMQQFTWLNRHYLVIASDLFESTLKMNIIPLDFTRFESSKPITVETVDFGHVIGFECRFDSEMFAMAVFDRFIYFAVMCNNGAKIGLVRGVISQAGKWYIPYGSLSYSNVDPRFYDGIFLHRLDKVEDTLFYSYKMKDDKISLFSRPLHYLNATARTSTVSDPERQVKSFHSPATMEDNVWVFKRHEGACSIQFGIEKGDTPHLHPSDPEIIYPCGLYAIQRVDGVDENTPNEYIDWKYENLAIDNGKPECALLSKLTKNATDCHVSQGPLAMYAIIGIESIAIVAIAVAFIVVTALQVWKAKVTQLALTRKAEPKTDARSVTKTPATDKTKLA